MQRKNSSMRGFPIPPLSFSRCSRTIMHFFHLTSEVSTGSVGRGAESRGTGDVASMRAGLRMIGSVMGGTPTCNGEARG